LPKFPDNVLRVLNASNFTKFCYAFLVTKFSTNFPLPAECDVEAEEQDDDDDIATLMRKYSNVDVEDGGDSGSESQ
jgi:transcriptional regulator of met regulon